MFRFLSRRAANAAPVPADDLTHFCRMGQQFRLKLLEVKQSLHAGLEWYPYDTLSSLIHLDRLLTGSNRSLVAANGTPKKVLDLGCQDGDLAFFLESLGHDVEAVDHPTYSHNGMRGLWALKSALASSVRVAEIDLDRQFNLHSARYDLVFFLGVLYHLRNPFYVLEELAKHATHCLLSTRIAARFPEGSRIPQDQPIAYLLRDRELNNDETNYFIFSETAFRVLLDRTHWRVLDYMTAGDPSHSDPVQRDQRVFCLLESQYGRVGAVTLGQGWHEAEGTGWRWTRREFTASLHAAGGGQRLLTMEIFVSPELLRATCPLVVSLSVNGNETPPAAYETSGPQTFVRRIDCGSGGEVSLHFRVNGGMPPDGDSRERGIVVNSISVE